MMDPSLRPRAPVRALALTLAAVTLPGLALAATAAHDVPAAQHAWEAGDTPASLENWVNAKLKSADAKVAELLAVTAPRTVENTLRPYDDAFCDISDAQAQAQVLYGVGATKELRDKAQALTQTLAPPGIIHMFLYLLRYFLCGGAGGSKFRLPHAIVGKIDRRLGPA